MELNIDKMARNIADKALDEIEYNGKTLRQWVDVILNITQKEVSTMQKDNKLKSPDLCDRCVHTAQNCKDCASCSLWNKETETCRCEEIHVKTPCPFFEELEK